MPCKICGINNITMVTDKKKQGKKNKASGKLFEAKTRRELESRGFTVCKWSNQVDLENDRIVSVKPKFNPFTHSVMYTGTGFPDFIAFKRTKDIHGISYAFEVIGIECKGGDINHRSLDKEEKAKCKWLLDHNIFSGIYLAQRGEKRGKIAYIRLDYNYL